ncbi:hypothetical protein V2J09_009062 [Rumex salicifolius]
MASKSARRLLAFIRSSELLRAPMLSSHKQQPLHSLSSSVIDSSCLSLLTMPPCLLPSRQFCSRTSSNLLNEQEGPSPEDEFQKLADSTIHELLEKFENQVLTLKLGDLGTYVLNKQTPNRQLWLSSPVSGPSRFDWDPNAQSWIYRRNNANLRKLMENELAQLCEAVPGDKGKVSALLPLKNPTTFIFLEV